MRLLFLGWVESFCNLGKEKFPLIVGKKKKKTLCLMCASRAGDLVHLLNITVFLPDSADTHDAAADLDGLQQRAALRHHVRGSGLKLGPRRSGRWGRGVATPLIMCDQLTGSKPPRFFSFLFKAKRIKSDGLISQPPEWRERLSDRRRPAD